LLKVILQELACNLVFASGTPIWAQYFFLCLR